MIGLIKYATTLASTPCRSPYHAADFYAADFMPWADTLPAAEQQSIYLDWYFKKQDPGYADLRDIVKAESGVAEINWYSSQDTWKLVTGKAVIEDRGGVNANDASVLRALNAEIARGTVLQWYPDFVNFPAEYYNVVVNKRIPERRIKNQAEWEFSFDFYVVPDVQFPSTVPPFV